MLTFNYFLSHIKGKLGAYINKLPELTDEEIIKVLRIQTLYKLSVYYPRPIQVVVNVEEHRNLDQGGTSRFFIVTPDGSEIINTSEVFAPTNGNYSSGYTFATSYAGDLINNLSKPETIKFIGSFEPPNIVSIQPNIPLHWSWFILKVNTVHRDFNTVKPGLISSVEKIALGDVAELIKGSRGFFTTINSEYGQIDLNLDVLNDAISAKEEEYKRMEESLHLQSNRQKIYYA
jgi:hypothetical protein